VLLSVALATAAALANTSSSVLQRKVAHEQPEASSSDRAMMWDLAHNLGGGAGIAAIIVGFGLQAGALATGRSPWCNRSSS